MLEPRNLCSRTVSLRSALAAAGIALVTWGVSEVPSTLAAFTDASAANVSRIATGNYYPTPLANGFECTTSGFSVSERANIKWNAVPGATGYRIVYVKASDGTVVGTPQNLPASQTSVTGITVPRNEERFVRLHTLNGPATSSGYRAAGLTYGDLVSSRTKCSGNYKNVENQAWENQTAWTPAELGPRQVESVQSFGLAEPDPGDPTPSSTPTAPPSGSDAPSTSTSATTPPSTALSPTEPTTTRPPSEVPTSSSTPPSPDVEPIDLGEGRTAKLVDENGSTSVVILLDDTEQCNAEIPGAATIEDNGDGRIAVANVDGEVRYMDVATCEIS